MAVALRYFLRPIITMDGLPLIQPMQAMRVTEFGKPALTRVDLWHQPIVFSVRVRYVVVKTFHVRYLIS